MKNKISRTQNTGKVVAAYFVASSFSIGAAEVAEETKKELDPTTIIASKFERKLSDVSQSVSVLDLEQLEKEGLSSLQDAVGYRIPGVEVTSLAGQRGQLGSFFVRGTRTNQSQVRIDGVRISDSNLGTGFFFSTARLYPNTRVEVLKGPQSSFYGGEAIGGVLGTHMERGEGDTRSELFTEVGSFNSYLGRITTQGEDGRLAYNLSLGAEMTSNDRDFHDSELAQLQMRLDYQLTDATSLGMTLRKADARSETPESFGPFDPMTWISNVVPSETHLDQQLSTFYIESAITEVWESKFTLGFYETAFDEKDTEDEKNSTDSEQLSYSWDNKITWNEKHTTVAGAFREELRYKNNGIFDARFSQGIYLNHSAWLRDNLQLNGGLRYEDYSDFDHVFTWNTGFIYHPAESWELKGNIGKSYRTPTFAELQGIPAFFIPASPDLKPATSIGWDMSVAKSFDQTKVAVTWFENDIEDSIGSDPMTFAAVNADGKTKTNGLEASIESPLVAIDGHVFLSYTYIQHDAIVNRARRAGPANAVSSGITFKVREDVDASLTATWVDQRNYGGVNLDDYVLVNTGVSYKVSENVTLTGRIENLLDERYLVSNFTNFGDFEYPARGRGLFAGVKVEW